MAILTKVQHIFSLYASRQLIVVDIHRDQEFGCIHEEVCPIQLDLVPKDGHTGKVERCIETLKERVRATPRLYNFLSSIYFDMWSKA